MQAQERRGRWFNRPVHAVFAIQDFRLAQRRQPEPVENRDHRRRRRLKGRCDARQHLPGGLGTRAIVLVLFGRVWRSALIDIIALRAAAVTGRVGGSTAASLSIRASDVHPRGTGGTARPAFADQRPHIAAAERDGQCHQDGQHEPEWPVAVEHTSREYITHRCSPQSPGGFRPGGPAGGVRGMHAVFSQDGQAPSPFRLRSPMTTRAAIARGSLRHACMDLRRAVIPRRGTAARSVLASGEHDIIAPRARPSMLARFNLWADRQQLKTRLFGPITHHAGIAGAERRLNKTAVGGAEALDEVGGIHVRSMPGPPEGWRAGWMNFCSCTGRRRGHARTTACMGTHRWRLRRYLPERHGLACRIFARGRGPGPRNIGVEFADGFRAVSFRWAVVGIRNQDEPAKGHAEAIRPPASPRVSRDTGGQYDADA